jgi:hypothetical protein
LSDSPNQVLCNSCKEWYDARASACYLCGEERPDVNAALKRATETAQLNGALSRQVANANAERRAEAQFRQAHNTGRADIADRPLTGVSGYSDLVGSIKAKLQNENFGS